MCSIPIYCIHTVFLRVSCCIVREINRYALNLTLLKMFKIPTILSFYKAFQNKFNISMPIFFFKFQKGFTTYLGTVR